MAAVHAVAIVGLVGTLVLQRVTVSACIIGLTGTVLTVFGISAGYHRLFAHRTYETGPLFRWLLLVLGAASFQTSAITWASVHRRHHLYVDRSADPYNATRGFWHSHIGWVLERVDEPAEHVQVPDLELDPLLRWQHRHVILIGACAGLALPTLVGWFFNDAWGGFLFGGCLRLVASYHLTFSINSFVHKFGTQPYSRRNSSRDCLFAALLTMGEGYHNYHHTFPLDYRNGARWYEFDPTKWTLRCWEWLGWAWSMKRTPAVAIARARWRVEQACATDTMPTARLAPVVAVSRRLDEALSEWSTLSRQRHLASEASAVQLDPAAKRDLDAQLRRARCRFQRERAHWRKLVCSLKRRGVTRTAAQEP